jgi:hypothetical protein
VQEREHVYLELFHGRTSVTEQLDDWGSPGPILGPFAYIQTTYATDIKIETTTGEHGVLYLCGDEGADLLYYDGVFYGDWSAFGADVLEKHPALKSRVRPFERAKAVVREDAASQKATTRS